MAVPAVAIEFLYARAGGKPAEAEDALRQALEATDVAVEADVRYTEVYDGEDAVAKRCLGSPTIRVAGRDVEYGEYEPLEYTAGPRYYNTPAGWKPFPHARLIANAILEAVHRAAGG